MNNIWTELQEKLTDYQAMSGDDYEAISITYSDGSGKVVYARKNILLNIMHADVETLETFQTEEEEIRFE